MLPRPPQSPPPRPSRGQGWKQQTLSLSSAPAGNAEPSSGLSPRSRPCSMSLLPYCHFLPSLKPCLRRNPRLRAPVPQESSGRSSAAGPGAASASERHQLSRAQPPGAHWYLTKFNCADFKHGVGFRKQFRNQAAFHLMSRGLPGVVQNGRVFLERGLVRKLLAKKRMLSWGTASGLSIQMTSSFGGMERLLWTTHRH